MTSEVGVMTSLEYAAADDDEDDDDDAGDWSLAMESSSLVSLPGSSAAAVNDFRPQQRSDYSADGTEKKVVPAPNRPSVLLYHDHCWSAYLHKC